MYYLLGFLFLEIGTSNVFFFPDSDSLVFSLQHSTEHIASQPPPSLLNVAYLCLFSVIPRRSSFRFSSIYSYCFNFGIKNPIIRFRFLSISFNQSAFEMKCLIVSWFWCSISVILLYELKAQILISLVYFCSLIPSLI